MQKGFFLPGDRWIVKVLRGESGEVHGRMKGRKNFPGVLALDEDVVDFFKESEVPFREALLVGNDEVVFCL